MAKPKKYKATAQPIFEAMIFDGSTEDLVDVFRWVEANTEGHFDPYLNTQLPSSGAYIDIDKGAMILANPQGVMFVKRGDFVVRVGPNHFVKDSAENFLAQCEPME